MTDCIFQLPDAVASQIAAGEVVQRPSSVLKELVENAVDAGSKSIRIYLKDAGKTLIQVIDDGVGMSPQDAVMAFNRHATSKIRDAKDLFALHSLGFRGEALPSIASVAEVVLHTRRADDELGTEVVMAGAEQVSVQPVMCAAGSDFSVKNLFYNIPVRRKFLKSDTAEFGHCLTEFRRVALTHPETSFVLFHNKNELFRLSATQRMQRIVQVFGQTMQKQLFDIEVSTPLVKISGYVAKPEFARKSSGEQYFFANGRFIRHPFLHKAVLQAFSSLIPTDYNPVYFIWLDVEPDAIDINIHPTKVDVKFENEQAIFQILNACVKESLGKYNILPPIDFNTENIMDEAMRPVSVRLPESPRPSGASYGGGRGSAFSETRINLPWEQLRGDFEQPGPAVKEAEPFVPKLHPEMPELPEMPVAEPAETMATAPDTASGTGLVLCKGRYVVTSVRNGLMFVDRRRAQERILYEYYLSEWENAAMQSQQCMFPETIELSSDDYKLCQELRDDLQAIGYRLTFHDDHQEVTVEGQPADFDVSCNACRVLEGLLDDFRDQDELLGTREKMALCISRMMALSSEGAAPAADLQHLIEELLTCSVPATTPSGEKIIHVLQTQDMEQWFNPSCL